MGKSKALEDRFIAINVTVPPWQLEMAQDIGTLRDDNGKPVLDASGNPIVNTSEGIRVLCEAGAALSDILKSVEVFKQSPQVPQSAKDFLEKLLSNSGTMASTDSLS